VGEVAAVVTVDHVVRERPAGHQSIHTATTTRIDLLPFIAHCSSQSMLPVETGALFNVQSSDLPLEE
jgi:hypothetical protein